MSRKKWGARYKFFLNIRGWEHALAGRCPKCAAPLIMVLKVLKIGGTRRIPIDVREGWDGSLYYKPGIHKFHGWRCKWTAGQVEDPEEVNSDIYK